MREAASRGFWVSTYAPYGYRKVRVQDGAKERPKLELDPPADAVVRRIFWMALSGHSVLDIVRTLNAEGIPTRNGGRWLKNTVHGMLGNEAYMGTLVWGKRAKSKAPPVRVDGAVPAIVSREEFERVQELLKSRAPKVVHPRRASSPYLLSGLVKCESCGRALTAAEAKSGKYTYYVCQSLMKRGKEACATPRLNAQRFEEMSEFLRTSEITETRSFVRSFVKAILVGPGRATIHYTIPTPPDSPIGGGDAADVALSGRVMSTVRYGGPTWI